MDARSKHNRSHRRRIVTGALFALAVTVAAACGSSGSGLPADTGAGGAGTNPGRGGAGSTGTGGGRAGVLPQGSFGPVASLTVPSFGEAPTTPTDAGFGNAPAGARQPVRFSQQAIFDPAAGNVPAMVFLLPNGWQAQGHVQWLPEWKRLAHLATTIFDPSTNITIDWLPVQDFIWFDAPGGFSAPIGGNYQGKAYVPPITDPTQFVAQFWMPTVLPHLQGATLTRIDQVPAIAQEYARQFGGTAEAYAHRLRYEFEQDGQAWEEEVSFALLYSTAQGVTSWYVNFAYTTRAPRGELDRNAGLISTVIASRTTTPEWEGIYRLVQQLFIRGLQQQMADTEAFGRTLAQHRAESQALQAQVAQERQALQDRIADLRGQSLQGIETYVNPIDGTLVQMPQGWVDYWVSPRGEFLTTDTPGFNPNDFDNQGWQRLQPRGR